VARGGSYAEDASNCTAVVRAAWPAGANASMVGFRPIRSDPFTPPVPDCGTSVPASGSPPPTAEATGPCPDGYVPVPAGEFDMGAPADEPGRYDQDGNVHHVTLTRPFCLKATDVTQGEWTALMGTWPSANACCDDCPVEQVDWWDALAYCNALSASEGLPACYELSGCDGIPGTGVGSYGAHLCDDATFAGLDCAGYRLPTEAEWEYAARAGTTTATYNGTSTLTGCSGPNPVVDPIGWYAWNACETVVTNDCFSSTGCKTQPVGTKEPNAWGLYDMLGNVEQWCWDLSDLGLLPATPAQDPTGTATGFVRIVRGGALDSPAKFLRAAYRAFATSGRRAPGIGFRCARTLTDALP
jgi:formylglycine-generating enzyme required for sulfatase activity